MKETLFKIQQEFKSSKNLVNDFAKFNYRNLEGMLADLKPILFKYNCIITFNDDIVNVGAYNYIKSTATITSLNTNESISTTAFAREDETKAGMSAGQMTGCGSSYSRKYALCGLCAVNEEKDLDAFDNRPKSKPQPTQQPYNNNHRECDNDDELMWKPDEPKKDNLTLLTEFCSSKKMEEGVNQDNLLRFYNYYKPKANTWKGSFNISQLFNKWMTN